MSTELSQAELERMVVGKVHAPTTVFYDQSKMNPELSKAAGRRVYQTILMVKYTQPGVTDWAPQRAQKEDIAAHPEEYQYYLNTKDDVGSPGIDIIPGMTPDEHQELIDYGLTSITKLCEAKTLPAHLTHVQESAWRIQKVFENERKENQQKGHQEGQPESSHQNEEIREGQVLPAQGRRNDQRDVGRHPVAGGQGDSRREAEEGLHPVRRVDSDQAAEVQKQEEVIPAFPSVNWKMSFG